MSVIALKTLIPIGCDDTDSLAMNAAIVSIENEGSGDYMVLRLRNLDTFGDALVIESHDDIDLLAKALHNIQSTIETSQ